MALLTHSGLVTYFALETDVKIFDQPTEILIADFDCNNIIVMEQKHHCTSLQSRLLCRFILSATSTGLQRAAIALNFDEGISNKINTGMKNDDGLEKT